MHQQDLYSKFDWAIFLVSLMVWQTLSKKKNGNSSITKSKVVEIKNFTLSLVNISCFSVTFSALLIYGNINLNNYKFVYLDITKIGNDITKYL